MGTLPDFIEGHWAVRAEEGTVLHPTHLLHAALALPDQPLEFFSLCRREFAMDLLADLAGLTAGKGARSLLVLSQNSGDSLALLRGDLQFILNPVKELRPTGPFGKQGRFRGRGGDLFDH